jgi:hypothetical protein
MVFRKSETIHRKLHHKKAIIQWETPFYWIEILGAKKDAMISLHKWIVSFAFASMALTLLLLKRNRKELLLFTFIIAYFTILNNVFFAYARYNLPLMPLLFLYIGLLVLAAWHMLFRKKQPPLEHDPRGGFVLWS